jgi:hypothetical protein
VQPRSGADSALDSLVERFQRVLPQLAAVTGEPTTRLPDVVRATEAVTVVLAPDGLPSRIEVSPQWRRIAGAADFARMVTEVWRQTAAEHAEAVAGSMSASGWTDRIADLFASLSESGLAPRVAAPAPRTAAPRTAAPRTAAPHNGSARSLEAIVADLVAASAALDNLAASVHEPSAGSVVGTGGRGRLELRVDASGAVNCAVDPDWAAGRDAAELNAALAAAVAELRASRDAGTAVPQRLLEANAQLAADLQALMESTHG